MKKMRELFTKKASKAMGNFAFAFACAAMIGGCFYIFHQPKMPEELVNYGEE